MTRDDIMRMARETDCLDDQHYGSVWADKLERFANLIAASEREECAKVVEQVGIDGYGTLAAALLVRERGAP
jgi:hypothetical protein